jgi:predicted O-methyltransferase YrrM
VKGHDAQIVETLTEEVVIKGRKMYEEAVKEIIKDEFSLFNFTVHAYPNAIGLWPNEQESLLWLGLNADPKGNLLEIGSFCGGSAVLLCLARKYLNAGPTVYSVDRGFERIFDHNLKHFSDLSKKITCDSIELAKHYDGSPISFAFIDGWHSFKGALTDFQTVEPWLMSNAFVAFHDVAWQPLPDGFIDEHYALAKSKYSEWMAEKLPNNNGIEQSYNLGGVVAWLVKEYGYKLVNVPVMNGVQNSLVALQKP